MQSSLFWLYEPYACGPGARLLSYNDPLSKILAVGCDDLFIPIERILTNPRECPLALIVQIDIDKTVALTHFTGARANDVRRAPRRIR